jgi:hypothetical protein
MANRLALPATAFGQLGVGAVDHWFGIRAALIVASLVFPLLVLYAGAKRTTTPTGDESKPLYEELYSQG